MKLNKREGALVLLSVLLSLLVVGLFGYLYINKIEKGHKNQLVKDYYDIENLVSVSPHGLRLKMDQGQFEGILVDLRSAEEYEAGHITGAINIPAYKDRFTSDYGAVERILGEFRKIEKDKEIIVYCYSVACMTGRKVGKMLADDGVFVKHLNIGWNEWKNDWKSWNHEHEWYTTWPEQYITKGKEPGSVKVKKEFENKGCPADGFGC